ncbi:hypothetical protein FS837_001567 [Tulasnella sp. UAMH 9824]|nr:hypothetical protein FS837_001567 [Tulasnella sp. UAMH 9824]
MHRGRRFSQPPPGPRPGAVQGGPAAPPHPFPVPPQYPPLQQAPPGSQLSGQQGQGAPLFDQLSGSGFLSTSDLSQFLNAVQASIFQSEQRTAARLEQFSTELKTELTELKSAMTEDVGSLKESAAVLEGQMSWFVGEVLEIKSDVKELSRKLDDLHIITHLPELLALVQPSSPTASDTGAVPGQNPLNVASTTSPSKWQQPDTK